MSISAMKQALEALEWNYGTDLENIENCTAWLDKLNATIPALRQAIAEAEKIVPSDYPNSHQQEPFAVAWVLDGELFWPSEYEVIAQAGDKAIPLYTTPVHAIAEAEKQEPVAIGEEWKPCVKLPIIVHVREQRKGETHVSTREGITPVKEDDLIMRGVAGEEYPIGRELFNRTYTFDTAPVHARPVVHEVRCTYPQCQATNGCVGSCSKGQQDLAKVGEVGVWGHQREWVGLTDEEVHDAFNFVEFIKQISFDRDRPEWCENFAAYIEAKLKEKNS